MLQLFNGMAGRQRANGRLQCRKLIGLRAFGTGGFEDNRLGETGFMQLLFEILILLRLPPVPLVQHKQPRMPTAFREQ